MKAIGVLAGMLLLSGGGGGPRAATCLVKPDGSGDFPTIQAAVDGSLDGDVIELADGTFRGDGNRDISFCGKGVWIRSHSGVAEGCVLDCEGSESEPHRAFYFVSGEGTDSILQGVTLENGWAPDDEWHPHRGGAVFTFMASPRIRTCVFRNNHAVEEGGGMYSRGGVIELVECTFENNSAGAAGGAWLGFWVSSSRLAGCVFVGNSADGLGGAVCGDGIELVIDDCLFLGNLSGNGWGGAVGSVLAELQIRGSTFAGNVASRGGAVSWLCESGSVVRSTFCGNQAPAGSAVDCPHGGSPVVESSLFVFGEGAAIECGSGQAQLQCCNIFGNTGGDWSGPLEGQLGSNGNTCLDPQFCSEAPGEHENWTLQGDSPCAPENSGCGLIGAFGVGCGTVPAEARTWGGVKLLFRE